MSGASEIPGGDDAPPGCGEHRRGQRRHRGLAVGARHRHDRRRRPFTGEVDLAPHRHAGGARGDERGMIEPDERARHDEIGRTDLGLDRVAAGASSSRGAERRDAAAARRA